MLNLENTVNNLASKLRDNFNDVTLIDIKDNASRRDSFQNGNEEQLELRLQKVNSLVERCFSLIEATNSPYCELIDFGYDVDSFDDVYIFIELLEKRMFDFQQSIGEALFKQLGNVQNDVLQAVDFLLKIGADLNFKSPKGAVLERAWDLARADEILPIIIKYSSPELLNQRFSDGVRPVTRALEEGRIELLDELLKHGAKVIPREIKDEHICYKPTLLHIAVAMGELQAIELLLSYGANPNVALQPPHLGKFVNLISKAVCGKVRGHTPLHEAIEFIIKNPKKMLDGLNIVMSLVRAGAKANIIDSDGLAVHDKVSKIADKQLQSSIQVALSSKILYNAPQTNVGRLELIGRHNNGGLKK